jgi:hypothetical protein
MIGGMWIPIDPQSCEAQDWAWDDTGTRVILYGTCRRPKGHTSRWHCDWDANGSLLAQWSGPRDARAPLGVPERTPTVEPLP